MFLCVQGCNYTPQLCTGKIEVISAPDSLPKKFLSNYSSSEILVSELISENKRRRFGYFGLTVDYNEKDKVTIQSRVYMLHIGVISQRTAGFKININDQEKIMTNDSEIIKEEEIDELFSAYYLNNGRIPHYPDSPESAYIQIAWQDGVKLSFVRNIIVRIINSYYGLLDTELCDLEHDELTRLKEQFPVILEFRRISPPKHPDVSQAAWQSSLAIPSEDTYR